MNQGTNSKEKLYESQLNRPVIWLIVFLFFSALPIFIYFMAYETYLQNSYDKAKESNTKFFRRELTAFGNKATNRQIFLQLFQSFRNNYRRNLPDNLEKGKSAIQDLANELPSDAAILIWNKNGELLEDSSRLAAHAQRKNELQSFIEKLLLAQNEFSTGTGLQTLHQMRLFEKQNETFFNSLLPITGRAFPLTQALTSPNTIFGGHLTTSEVFFYWDFFNSRNNDQGGMAIFIPIKDLAPTYGLSQALKKDPSANPEFTNGFFNSASEEIELSYSNLLTIAQSAMAEYKETMISPVSLGDWVVFFQPLVESSSVNIFSIFSTRQQRANFESEVKSAQIIALIAFFICGFLFYHYFRIASTEGLSLKKKLGGLFFLCMQLPLAILIFLGLKFSLSQQRLLSSDAESNLVELVKRIDHSANDFYRVTNEWLKSIKTFPEVKTLDTGKMHEKFFEFSKNKQLKSLYLVGESGEIAFDIDNLTTSEDNNKVFIRQLGTRILSANNDSDTLQNVSDSSLSEGLFDLITRKTGLMHLALWPGSSQRNFVFTDILETDDGNRYALIAMLDKTEIDGNYLKQAVTNQYKINPDREVFILKESDISETVPKITTTFRANLLPMISTTKISNLIEADIIQDEDDVMLVALGRGVNVEDYLVGARYNWFNIIETMHKTYFLVALSLFFSLAASLLLVTLLIREFLIPVSFLSSGAKSIIGGNLDTTLRVFAKDELGELSKTFNLMTRRLRNRITELTVLYNLTQKASTSHSQREVFEMAANNLLTHLGANSCGTVWINEGEGDDGLYLSEHLGNDESEEIRACSRTSLKGFQTTIVFSERINKCVMSVPLYFEDKKFGALYLIFNENRTKENISFSEDEKSFIETLRHHLSLIIEKQRLFEQAITDGLTKLYMRRFFLATLEKEMNRTKRYQLDVSMLLLDIDKFKDFNDTYGHQAGDFVLRETAQRITESIRSVDTPGRYGGEEMAVILPQTNIKEAYVVAERIRKAIEGAEYRYKNDSMRVTASIGVSALHLRDISLEELIEEADKALYVAKDKGRNQVRIAPEAM